jgi:hypothetical protein
MQRHGPTLATFVDEWWALYAEPNLERATLRKYRWVWERHARPRLGDVRLVDVTPLNIARSSRRGEDRPALARNGSAAASSIASSAASASVPATRTDPTVALPGALAG